MDDTTVVSQQVSTNVISIDEETSIVVSAPPVNTVLVTEVSRTVVSSFCGPSYLIEVPRFVVEYTALMAIPASSIVRLNADEKVVVVNNTNLDDYDMALGVTLHDVAPGGSVRIMVSGILEKQAFSFTPNKLVYVITDGVISSTPPTTGFLQSVGKAITSTAVFIDISISVIL